MSFLLPQDANGNSIQLLRPSMAAGAAKAIAPAGGSQRSAAFTTGVARITLAATADLRYRLGDSTVEAAATDHFIGAGERLVLDCRGFTHVAAFGTGTLHVTELD